MPPPDGGGNLDQPPPARRTHGLRAHARRNLHRVAAEGHGARSSRTVGGDAQHRRMVGWPDRIFIELVGTEHPIIQAPMAGAAGVALCVAAIRGGALGSLPCGMLSPEAVRDQVREVREQVSGPLNLNFFCHRVPEAVDDSEWRRLLQPFYDEFGVALGDGGTMRM